MGGVMAPVNLLEVEQLAIDFGGVSAVDNVSFVVDKPQVFSIIGPNGAGKTTLFNVLSGLYRPSRGRVRLQGEDVTALAPHRLAARGVSRTFQNLQNFSHMTVRENVMVGRHLLEQSGIVSQLLFLPSVSRENRTAGAVADTILARVGLEKYALRSANALPYGALKRLEIARALAAEPILLLLDEPAAGCNAIETQELDQLVRSIADDGVGIILIEHDMKLVMKISDCVMVMDSGRNIAAGSPQAVRRDPAVIAAYLGSHADHANDDADG
jgi:branched-chain amino acid transport system ATP-binding protein